MCERQCVGVLIYVYVYIRVYVCRVGKTLSHIVRSMDKLYMYTGWQSKVAVCGSLLQYVVVCCSVLQRWAEVLWFRI